MGLPAPSPEQEQALADLKAVADAGAAAGPGKVAAIQGALDKQQEVEDFQKETFDVLNDEIIRRYEKERRWLNGTDIAAPILEADIQAFAAGDESNRLWNGGDFSPLRINEFDGTPLVLLEQEHENSQLAAQDLTLNSLQNGFTGMITLEGTAKIADAFTSSSTQIKILDNTTAIAIGNKLFLAGGGNSAVVQVTGISGYCTDEDTPPQLTESACLLDNGTWHAYGIIDVIIIVPPIGTIPATSPIGQGTFSGFNNTERTNHVASDSDFQGIMDNLLLSLENILNNRITALDNQINELQNNENDNLPAQPEIDNNTSKTAVQNFLGVTPPSTIDISDTGITAFDAEKATRQGQITARITAIDTELATDSFFDQRFNTSDGRCKLNNGSVNLLKDLTQAKAEVIAGTAEAAGLSDRYNALIP